MANGTKLKNATMSSDIKLGTLVEVISQLSPYYGLRLFVVSIVKDYDLDVNAYKLSFSRELTNDIRIAEKALAKQKAELYVLPNAVRVSLHSKYEQQFLQLDILRNLMTSPVYFEELKIIIKKDNYMKVSELTDKELALLAIDEPGWVADNRPEWMANNNTEWMCKHRSAWMSLNRPHVLFNYWPEWMADNRPEWMAINEPASMMAINPEWMKEYLNKEVPDELVVIIKRENCNDTKQN